MIYTEIMNAPHTLIAGTTGSGKSTLMNGIIRELIENDKPMILIDPKMVELSIYEDCDNCIGYAENLDDIMATLGAVIDIIKMRYQTMKDNRIRFTDEREIYVIIDELADLMISERKKDVQKALQKILQIGRAAGIHIIAATQSPSRKVIPAELVLNFTDRIALRCLSAIESRQVINKAGAEKLPKYGTAIYMNGDGYREVEIPYVSTEDAEAIAEMHSCGEIEIVEERGSNAGLLVAAFMIIPSITFFIHPILGIASFVGIFIKLLKSDLSKPMPSAV